MKKFLVYFSLSLSLVLFIPNSSEARAVLLYATSYVDANGCIHIYEEWGHYFLGINWYTTKNDYMVNCPN
jgi:hypothetical protein